MKVTDIAKSVDINAKHKIVGIRPGEKIHEKMISKEDSLYTYEYGDYYKILPVINEWSSDEKRIKDGKKVNDGFSYTSDNNPEWMNIATLKQWIATNKDKIGYI